MELILDNQFSDLTINEMQDLNGGVFSITILGIVYTGWKAYAIVTGAISLVSLGIYNGYKDTKN